MPRTESGSQKAPAPARQLAGWLRERFGNRIADIRLFGSWARGEADADSDVDVLVVFEDTPTREEREEISWRRYDIDLENGTVTSVSGPLGAALAPRTGSQKGRSVNHRVRRPR